MLYHSTVAQTSVLGVTLRSTPPQQPLSLSVLLPPNTPPTPQVHSITKSSWSQILNLSQFHRDIWLI